MTAEQAVRRRIAHMLHDDLQQLLFAVEMQLDFLRADEGENVELNEITKTIRQAISVTRQLSVDLSPPVLENEGITGTLTWLAQHMTDVYQLQVTVETIGQPATINVEQRILLYQIVRELLFNVVKHAGVREAQVTLQAEADGFTIIVSDQGQGFDVADLFGDETSQFGLRSVNERLQLIGGRAAIDSQPDAGTRVTLWLPHVQSAGGDKVKA
jgi:signal transduction histidine kinase